jgi:chromate reductase, NAD(P)H dehydrogenase (quinone)
VSAVRVLAVSGSLRVASFNSGLLRALAELAPPGVRVEQFGGLEAVPPFNEDREALAEPRGLAAWRRALRAADVVVFATPEYNTTIPGQLKNAVDWGSRPFGPDAALWGKPVAVMGASKTGYGALWAQADLRKALAKAGARVLTPELAVPHAHHRHGEDGTLLDDGLRRRIEVFLEQVLEETPVAAAA